MLQACFVPTILCFVYTLRNFYTFSGTNLLTRCHSSSSCFLLFLVSEKLVSKYSQNCTKPKPKFLFFQTLHGVRRRDEESPRGIRTRGHAGPPWAAPPYGVGPSGINRPCPFAYINPRVENTRYPIRN